MLINFEIAEFLFQIKLECEHTFPYWLGLISCSHHPGDSLVIVAILARIWYILHLFDHLIYFPAYPEFNINFIICFFLDQENIFSLYLIFNFIFNLKVPLEHDNHRLHKPSIPNTPPFGGASTSDDSRKLAE